jgi:hypothetical protein
VKCIVSGMHDSGRKSMRWTKVEQEKGKNKGQVQWKSGSDE